MKARIMLFAIALVPLYMTAQSAILPSPSVSAGIETSLDMALGKGDVEVISKHFANKVELTIVDETETVMKQAATDRLTEFYEANSPRAYHLKSMVDGIRETGELVTLSGNYKIEITYTVATQKKKITALGIGAVSPSSVSVDQ